MSFEDRYKYYLNIVEGGLQRYLPEAPGNSVYEAMRYSVFAGGKRLRPVLVLAVCDMFGGDVYSALPFAVAIELIHTYSLIHDDLPCMDDDDLRRGRPTCHKEFSEAVALLAGDALLTKAFAISAEGKGQSAEVVARVIGVIAKAVGVEGMIGGQAADMELEGTTGEARDTVDRLLYMIEAKTAYLIQAAAEVGAVAAGADEGAVAQISEFAKKLGLSFQINDDILDLTGDTALLGKPVRSDEKNMKCTFVTFFGIEQAMEAVRSLSCEAEDCLAEIGRDTAFLSDFVKFLVNRER